MGLRSMKPQNSEQELSTCRICGAQLTDPLSVKLGIGPICRGLTNAHRDTYGEQQDMITNLREPPKTGIRHDIVFSRRHGEPHIDCPWTVIYHSPAGMEWGYAGSGPADFALNILNAYIPPGADGKPPVKMSQGFASQTAVELHQDFKFIHVATKPSDGGVITRQDIEEFLEMHNWRLTQHGIEKLDPSLEDDTEDESLNGSEQ